MILAPAMIDNEQDSQKCCFRFVTYDMLAGVFLANELIQDFHTQTPILTPIYC